MKPILFSTPMVQAILEGRKTQTRRVVPEKIVDEYYEYDEWCNAVMPHDIPCVRTYEREFYEQRTRYYPDDILWVKETFLPYNDTIYYYKADEKHLELERLGIKFKWRPSIYMPRAATRIFLRVTDVRVERVQDISPQDAKAEGVSIENHIMRGGYGGDDSPHYREEFAALWDSINAKRGYGWDTNCWVWVYTFERCEPPSMIKQGG